MRPLYKFIYGFTIAYIFLSPLLDMKDLRPSVVQKWPMYVGTRPFCTLRFDEESGPNPNYHLETARLVNAAWGRPPSAPYIIPNEAIARHLLAVYCGNPALRLRPLHARFQCMRRNTWVDFPEIAEIRCHG